MPHTYKSTYPPYTKVDSGIVQFFEDFYKLSDTPDAHDEYVDQFTKDATLVMASKKGVGSEGISSPVQFPVPMSRFNLVTYFSVPAR